jgi:hypothetical protein
VQKSVLAALFLNIEVGENEIFLHDRTNFLVSHEGVHLSPRRALGSAEDQKDGFVPRNGF